MKRAISVHFVFFLLLTGACSAHATNLSCITQSKIVFEVDTVTGRVVSEESWLNGSGTVNISTTERRYVFFVPGEFRSYDQEELRNGSVVNHWYTYRRMIVIDRDTQHWEWLDVRSDNNYQNFTYGSNYKEDQVCKLKTAPKI